MFIKSNEKNEELRYNDINLLRKFSLTPIPKFTSSNAAYWLRFIENGGCFGFWKLLTIRVHTSQARFE